jgi:hypothetical protein
MNKKSHLIVFFIIILTVFSRLFINIPNFTAIGALALFCGAIANKNRFSIIIPFIALFASDLMLISLGKQYLDYFKEGYFLYVYIAFAATWFIGKLINNRLKTINIILASLASSISFFLITNFGSWLQLAIYPKTLQGLGQSYLAGIAFYKTGLYINFLGILGDLFFTALFFGTYFFMQYLFVSKLRPVKIKN